MNKSTLGVHKIKLMVKTSPSLSDSSGVRQHTNGTLDLGEITTGYNGWGLVVDTNFETGGTPVDKLDGAFGLDGSDGSVDILGDNIASVEHAADYQTQVRLFVFIVLIVCPKLALFTN